MANDSTKTMLGSLTRGTGRVLESTLDDIQDEAQLNPKLINEPSPEMAELLANILGPDFSKKHNPYEG